MSHPKRVCPQITPLVGVQALADLCATILVFQAHALVAPRNFYDRGDSGCMPHFAFAVLLGVLNRFIVIKGTLHVLHSDKVKATIVAVNEKRANPR